MIRLQCFYNTYHQRLMVWDAFILEYAWQSRTDCEGIRWYPVGWSR